MTISLGDKPDTSLTTPTIRPIAIAIRIIIPPSLSAIFPSTVATLVIAATNKPNATINVAPLAISAGDNLPMILAAMAMISIDVARRFIILPASPMFLADLPLTSFPYAAITAPIAAIIPTRPLNPRSASSGFNLPMILTAVAINKIAAPILNKDVFNPLIAKPFSSLANDSPSSLFMANANATRIAASAPIADTPFHKDVVSSLARR